MLKVCAEPLDERYDKVDGDDDRLAQLRSLIVARDISAEQNGEHALPSGDALCKHA